MGKSLAEELAELPEEEYNEVLSAFTEDELKDLQYDADFWLRPEQKIHEGDNDWFITAVIAGRGFGKTRLACEWIRRYARENPGCKIAVAGRTSGDVRRIMVDGESGLLAVCPPSERPEYKQQKAALYFPNGSEIELHSSESPDSARGVQYHATVGDEFAAWKPTLDSSGTNLYNNLIAATRLGQNPQILLTTTPKRTPTMQDIYKRAENPKEKIRIVRGSTLDNSNLPQSFIDNLIRQYGDSDLARQEVYGELLGESEGIVFTDQMILKAKQGLKMPSYPLKIIAVDPSVSSSSSSDLCGIMAMGSTVERDPTRRRGIVYEDASLRASPDVWVKEVVRMAHKYGTKQIVVEKNQGGDLLKNVLLAEDNTLSIHLVSASKGKVKRAEPVVVLMQQGRILFNEDFPELCDELLFYDPENSNYSPDRMDAFVWGSSALLLGIVPGLRIPFSSTFNPSQVQLPTKSRGTTMGHHTSSVKRQR